MIILWVCWQHVDHLFPKRKSPFPSSPQQKERASWFPGQVGLFQIGQVLQLWKSARLFLIFAFILSHFLLISRWCQLRVRTPALTVVNKQAQSETLMSKTRVT